MTIREYITEIQKELQNTVTPDRASELISILSSLLGNANDDIERTQVAYNNVLLEVLDDEKTAVRAKIRAQVTPEYLEYQKAKNTKELVIEMMRGLKIVVKNKWEEYREAKY